MADDIWRSVTSPPPIGEQLDEELRRAAEHGLTPVFRREVRIHGEAHRSFVFVMRDASFHDAFRRDLEKPPSDEIRIYDTEDDELHLAFRWRSQGAGEVGQAPEGDQPPFLFRVRGVRDYDLDGQPEVLGAFERHSLASGPYPVPVIIIWDESRGAYALQPLIESRPALERHRDFDPALVRGYTTPSLIVDRSSSKESFEAYPVHQYEVTPHPGAPVLTAMFLFMKLDGREQPVSEVKGWKLDFQGRADRTAECFPADPRSHAFARDSTNGHPWEIPVDSVAAVREDPSGCFA